MPENHNVIKHTLTTGATIGFVVTETREISLVRGGELAYLWIGNSDNPQFCYGTLSGATNLRKLAKAILREVGEESK